MRSGTRGGILLHTRSVPLDGFGQPFFDWGACGLHGRLRRMIHVPDHGADRDGQARQRQNMLDQGVPFIMHGDVQDDIRNIDDPQSKCCGTA